VEEWICPYCGEDLTNEELRNTNKKGRLDNGEN
jgi:hypothetical protein